MVVAGEQVVYALETSELTGPTGPRVATTTLRVLVNGEETDVVSLTSTARESLRYLDHLDTFITDWDMDFDGTNDVAVLEGVGGAGSYRWYTLHRFDPSTRTLEPLPGFTYTDVVTGKELPQQIENPQFDPERQRITSSYTHMGTRSIRTSVFQYTGAEYELATTTTQGFER
ncbi:hypothetical protein GVX82_01845 [Patescibacteria group bacterium]|jgi:hypothetical protein|nr:hypothetical protein [Patescibacteria group bacterium]